LRDPVNFNISYYGDLERVALEILSINSTDSGFNKYQGIPFHLTESIKCNYNLLPYGN
jgi:hypothetical protein